MPELAGVPAPREITDYDLFEFLNRTHANRHYGHLQEDISKGDCAICQQPIQGPVMANLMLPMHQSRYWLTRSAIDEAPIPADLDDYDEKDLATASAANLARMAQQEDLCLVRNMYSAVFTEETPDQPEAHTPPKTESETCAVCQQSVDPAAEPIHQSCRIATRTIADQLKAEGISIDHRTLFRSTFLAQHGLIDLTRNWLQQADNYETVEIQEGKLQETAA